MRPLKIRVVGRAIVQSGGPSGAGSKYGVASRCTKTTGHHLTRPGAKVFFLARPGTSGNFTTTPYIIQAIVLSTVLPSVWLYCERTRVKDAQTISSFMLVADSVSGGGPFLTCGGSEAQTNL